MAVLQSTNVQGSLCVNGVAVGGGKDFKYCCFTASTTWTPTQDLVDGDGHIEAFVTAGGGGGGFAASCIAAACYASRGATSYGASGGGGSVAKELVKIDATDACTVTVGAGGKGSMMPSWFDDPSVNCVGEDGGNSKFADIHIGGGGGGLGACFRCFNSPAQCAFCTYGSEVLNGGRLLGSPGGGAANIAESYFPNIVANTAGYTGGNCFYVPRLNQDSCYSASVAGGDAVCYKYIKELQVFQNKNQVSLFRNCIGGDREAYGNPGVTYDGAQYGMSAHGNQSELNNNDLISCQSYEGMAEADSEWVNNYLNMYEICQASQKDQGFFCNVATASQRYNSKYKGAGGLGAVSYSANNPFGQACCICSCAVMGGLKGNDGIVILKWFE